jgi:hypothetical protein
MEVARWRETTNQLAKETGSRGAYSPRRISRGVFGVRVSGTLPQRGSLCPPTRLSGGTPENCTRGRVRSPDVLRRCSHRRGLVGDGDTVATRKASRPVADELMVKRKEESSAEGALNRPQSLFRIDECLRYVRVPGHIPRNAGLRVGVHLSHQDHQSAWVVSEPRQNGCRHGCIPSALRLIIPTNRTRAGMGGHRRLESLESAGGLLAALPCLAGCFDLRALEQRDSHPRKDCRKVAAPNCL